MSTLWQRHTEGVAWRPAPGVHRWSSVTVARRPSLLWVLAWLFLLGPLWLVIEIDALFVTMLAALVAIAWYQAPPEWLHIRKAGWFWLADLYLPPGGGDEGG